MPETSRQPDKVGLKNLILIATAVGLMLVVVWFREAGASWALYLLAAVPLVGLLFWLRVPAEQRSEAEAGAAEALRRTPLGRAWRILTWILYGLAALIAVKLIVESAV